MKELWSLRLALCGMKVRIASLWLLLQWKYLVIRTKNWESWFYRRRRARMEATIARLRALVPDDVLREHDESSKPK